MILGRDPEEFNCKPSQLSSKYSNDLVQTKSITTFEKGVNLIQEKFNNIEKIISQLNNSLSPILCQCISEGADIKKEPEPNSEILSFMSRVGRNLDEIEERLKDILNRNTLV